MKEDFMFTSESVTEGHPDKLCDQISDAIVDRFLQQDPFSRVIAECAVSTAIVFVAARFHAKASVDFATVAREIINGVGYEHHAFNGRTCSIVTSLAELPPDDNGLRDEMDLTEPELERIPVRNQVTVFGFACNQTPSRMPLPIWLAHKLARQLTTARVKATLPYLAPDGKTQVGIEYRKRRPYRIHSLTVIASQNRPSEPDLKKLTDDIRETVILPVFADEPIRPDDQTRIFVNPDGPFIVGGPSIHSGLTGRKNAIDTYGEYSRHSGSALSGKDPTRIDRIGAYMARCAAKNVVAAGMAEECEVQLSYSIGLSRPVSIQVQTLGTGRIPDSEISSRLEKLFDFRPAGIIRAFRLRHLPAAAKDGFYRKLAAYGHVGRTDLDLPWERTDQAGVLKSG
ncbi:MAG TPA: methionine adenosyltransferase [Nitrospiria bacterium]|nr:methionine adenosyltransferase [Nitrospiria bacterium]